MRSTARWVGGQERRFAPDATSGRVEKTPAPGNLPRLPMELPKPLIFLAAAHERIARLASKTRERDNAII
jgi:hypothetical protein